MPYDARSKDALLEINHQFVMWCRREALAFHVPSGATMGKEAFAQYIAAHWDDLQEIDANGAPVATQSPGAVWWSMRNKRSVRDIVLDPSLPEYDGQVFNRWHNMVQDRVEPDLAATPESIGPLLRHLMLISDDDEEGTMFFLNWLAHLYQHPEVKMPTGIMLYSRDSRVGKSMLHKLLAPVFSRQLCHAMPGEELHKKFTDSLTDTWLLVLNELAQSDRADSYERFKSWVSEDTLRHEGKGDKSVRRRNILHFIITTNNAGALPLMENDGRILVLRTERPRQAPAYYDEFGAWIEGPGPALLAGVLARWQFPEGWNARAPAPQTTATVAMQREAASPLEEAVLEILDARRPPFDKDFGSTTGIIETLGRLYPTLFRNCRATPKGLAKVLRKRGAVQKQAWRVGEDVVRCWIWRSFDKWETATPEERLLHKGL